MATETVKKRRRGLIYFFRTLWRQVKEDRRAYIVFLILQAFAWFAFVTNIVDRDFENAFTALLAILLMLIPPFIEKNFHLELPTALEIVAYAFVFCAQILGELADFYTLIPFWDTLLHTCNGFMFAAFGFCLVDILNKSGKVRFELSPLFLAVVAFCFAMTIGVLWEFFEFAADRFFSTDMQKDTLVSAINSVVLPNDAGNKVSHVRDIVSTTVTLSDGASVEMRGYLDIGLVDTMEDLFVNLIGSTVFSVLGYLYVKHGEQGRVAKQFIPVVKPKEKEPPATEGNADGLPAPEDDKQNNEN